MTTPEALAAALAHHQAGRIAAAEQIYRQILSVEPHHPDAWHLLGVANAQLGRFESAVECIGRAIVLRPDYAEAHFNLGAALQDLGRPDEAIASYRRALEWKPDYAEALSDLGDVFCSQKKFGEAIESYRRALALRPDDAEVHYSLGAALQGLGKPDDAILCYRRALELRPDYAEAHNNLGNALAEQKKPDEAITCYRRALALRPAHPEMHYNLGRVFQDLQRPEEATRCYRRALELKPDHAEAHNNLGNALKDLGKLDEAIACYRRSLALKPDRAETHYNLGTAFQNLGRPDEAIASYRHALRLTPEYPEAHNNLGSAFQDRGDLDQAVACYRRALESRPDHLEAHNNLGNALKDQGRLDEAIACYRRALELKPDCAEAYSNLLYVLNFCPGYDAKTVHEEHRRWNERCAQPLAKSIKPLANDRSPDRRLRIGYVSPDFRRHPVGRFLLPILESHDHAGFEISCYASVQRPEDLTDQCRANADVWRNAFGCSDEQVADMIRRDQIDVLVDLTVHMAHNRLLVFARKPAPVQVTYLAYCGTTGLHTMDYRLTDPYLDPPTPDESVYCERSIYLPETYWCYRPVADTPPVSALPALQTGRITFGCLNNFCKVTAPTLAAWSELLRTMPESRLLLHAPLGSHRNRLWDYLALQDISPDRLEFASMAPTADYFGLYRRIDVALDPFPYGGGTTTCDALWMGVPVVSLAGQTAMGRAGLSILSNLGLSDLAGRDVEHYVRIAAELAGDRPRLSALRASLRDRMRKSPLMDTLGFTRNIEAAYRTMWRNWCRKEDKR